MSLEEPGRVEGLSLRSTMKDAIDTVSSRICASHCAYSGEPSGKGRFEAGSSGFGQRFGMRVFSRHPRGLRIHVRMKDGVSLAVALSSDGPEFLSQGTPSRMWQPVQ